MPVELGERAPTIADIAAVAQGGEKLTLDGSARARITRARAVVEAHLAAGSVAYGLTRELGAGRDIVVDDVLAFQRRVLRNHDAGVGEPLPTDQVRAVIAARIAGFALGGAGVRLELVEAWIALLDSSVTPVVRRIGSVGAADLTHLAAIASVVSGAGAASVDGVVLAGEEALRAAGLEPLDPAPSEALASLSASSYSVGVGALVLHSARDLAATADLAAALSVEALAVHGAGGSLRPFDARVNGGSSAQGQSASRIRDWLAGSVAETRPSASTQDPVSLRSSTLVSAAWSREWDSAVDEVEHHLRTPGENPLVVDDELLPNGNFQTTSLALRFEGLRLALAHLAAASERRLAIVSTAQAPHRRSGAASVPGLLSYVAAEKLAELRHLAGPVTISGSVLSAGVEDVSSFAATALQLLERSIDLTRDVLTIEAVTAAELVQIDHAAAGALAEVIGDLTAQVVSAGDSAELLDTARVAIERAVASGPSRQGR